MPVRESLSPAQSSRSPVHDLQSSDYKSPPPVSNHQSTISTHSSQAITVWSTICTARQTFHAYLPDPLTLCLPTFPSIVPFPVLLCSSPPPSQAPPLPPDLLDTDKDYYTQISPLKDSYSPPTHLDIELFSFPSAPLNKPVYDCTYLCVLCLPADRRPDPKRKD